MRTDLNCSSVRHLCPSPSLFCQAIFSGVFTDLLPPHNFDRYVAAADAYVVPSGSLLFGRRSGSMALAKGQSLAELIAAGAPAPRSASGTSNSVSVLKRPPHKEVLFATKNIHGGLVIGAAHGFGSMEVGTMEVLCLVLGEKYVWSRSRPPLLKE